MTLYYLTPAPPDGTSKPAVRILSTRPILISKRNLRLPAWTGWPAWIQSLNKPEGWEYLKDPKSGYFQTGYPIEQIEGFMGNVVDILETKLGWGRVRCINYYNNPPTSFDPAIIHRYTVLRNGILVGSVPEQRDGTIVYAPLISDVPMWINMNFVSKYVPAASTPPYTLSTITGPRGVVIHKLQIDTTRVKFYVTPSSSNNGITVPIRPSDALVKYGLLACWNGDGFEWLSGGMVQALGSWASEGHIYQQNILESPSLYISKANQFAFQKPSSQWNTISFPNRLISAGSINLNLESQSITPRTAMGWSSAGSIFYAIVADGSEAQGVGLTKPETAQILHDLGCFEAVLCDSGGSSSMAVTGQGRVSAANDNGEERAVANCVGIY